eukprot:m.69660 g.69660  ORF g.69660 m.69660 type:complete len:103 (-) comp12071_c0_seq4:44-352(-)
MPHSDATLATNTTLPFVSAKEKSLPSISLAWKPYIFCGVLMSELLFLELDDSLFVWRSSVNLFVWKSSDDDKGERSDGRTAHNIIVLLVIFLSVADSDKYYK